MKLCVAETIAGLCQAPAEVLAEALCVHEHVRRGPLCEYHAKDLPRAMCLVCSLSATQPHKCEVGSWVLTALPSEAVA